MAQTREQKQFKQHLKEQKIVRAAYKKKTDRIKKIARIDKALGDNKGIKSLSKSDKKILNSMKKVERMNKDLSKIGKPEVMKRVAKKSLARRLVGKHLAKAIPVVGAAIIARDVVKGISKATCSKKGGKWVSGKCQGAKKDTRKITSPKARDLKSKR